MALTKKMIEGDIVRALGHPAHLQPGQRVTCSYRAPHDHVGKVHVGKVLAIDDPRAWANTGAFPEDKPNRRLVKEHVARHPSLGTKDVPVLYAFGVRWDRIDCLSPVSRR